MIEALDFSLKRNYVFVLNFLVLSFMKTLYEVSPLMSLKTSSLLCVCGVMGYSRCHVLNNICAVKLEASIR